MTLSVDESECDSFECLWSGCFLFRVILKAGDRFLNSSFSEENWAALFVSWNPTWTIIFWEAWGLELPIDEQTVLEPKSRIYSEQHLMLLRFVLVKTGIILLAYIRTKKLWEGVSFEWAIHLYLKLGPWVTGNTTPPSPFSSLFSEKSLRSQLGFVCLFATEASSLTRFFFAFRLSCCFYPLEFAGADIAAFITSFSDPPGLYGDPCFPWLADFDLDQVLY